MGGAALVLLFGCALVFVASLLLRSNWSAAQSSSAMQRAALPTPTPRPQVIVQPPPDGVDYESAVLMQLYSQVNPSVVNVAIYQLGANIHSDDIAGLSADAYYEAGSGSGFVWDSEGHIVTNNHVVEGAERIVVRFSDGTMSAGEVIGADRHSDLAVIHIDPEGYNLVPVRQGNLDEVQVGQRVAAIGNPFGLDGTLTSGIVSAIGRSIPSSASFSIPASIQTDAPINPGNSGGPLLNERGEVIGVNAQIRSEERANSGVGFAIPISIVQRVVPSLIQDGRYRHPYIGISGSSFSPICADEQRLDPRLRGAMVLEVLPGTPAAKAGLMDGEQGVNTLYPEICPRFRGGDVITAVNGSLVGSFDEVLSFLQRFTSPGDTVDFTVLRNGDSLQIPVTLTERPQSR
jgi:2-alkenal reductase